MEVLADTRKWAEATFGSVQLGDRRRTSRLVHSAAKIAEQPEKAFTQTFDWNELRGFYRLCDQKRAGLETIQGPHWAQTRQAMGQYPLVLNIHDTSEMDYTHHPALRGAGPIGDGNGTGFLQHNSLAVLPQPRQVLGLSYQQLTVRQPVEKQSSFQRRKRNRESALWLQGIRAAGRPPEGSCWVDVCDRGADCYEVMRASIESGHDYLIRVCQDRTVFTAAERDQAVHLMEYARTLASVGIDSVAIPARGGRPARTAAVCLAAAPVWVPAPAGTKQRLSQPVLAAYVIRIWEPQPPAGLEEPLEWILLCSLPTSTLEELKDRRDWYCCRWMVEVYHNIEKNGCSEEDRRFETAARMKACLAILAVVAVRVYQLRCALENIPDEPAQQVATDREIKIIRRLTGTKGRLSVRDFVLGVAKLGGFLGRKSDGLPGVRALWRGYQRLQDMVHGVRLHDGLNSG
jgi:hypothetical protein